MKKQTTGVYLLKEDKILFLVRQKENDSRHKQGIYLPIGGHVEDGEDIQEAAIREAKEESGISVHSVDLRGVIFIRGQAEGKNDIIMSLFTSSDFTGHAITGREGYFEWIHKNNLSDITLYEGDVIFLKYLFTSQFFVIDFKYNGFDLVSHTVLKLIT